MSEIWWTWVLFAFELFGITGMWYVGKKLWWGWLIVLTHSIPWFIYSLSYGKPGFIAMSFMWWTVNFINMRKWFKESRVKNMTTIPKAGQAITANVNITKNVTPKHRDM